MGRSYNGRSIMGMFGRLGTQLAKPDETRFQSWRATLPADLQNMSDYDLRGAWQGQAQQNGRAHMPDTWKLPNHYTFSDGSMYSNQQNGMGGHWADAAPSFTGPEDQHPWAFWATPDNLRQHSAPDLMNYFRQNEPASTVVLPINYRLPR